MIYTENIKGKIALPKDVRLIIDTLQFKGFEAFAVGGCIRDSLMGKTPSDWDITTSAKPQQVRTLFVDLGYKVVDTGIKHGTVTILIQENSYEVTTYRIEGEYLDSRHPSEVFFTNKLKDDLGRRDFTINAMAYNDEQGLKDYFNGLKDMEQKSIKTVGNAEHRFKEDALRILRAVRFSTILNYSIDEQVEDAIINSSRALKNISVERVRDEFIKIILSNRPAYGMQKLCDLKLIDFIIPEIDEIINIKKNEKNYISIFKQGFLMLDSLESSLPLRLSAIIYTFIHINYNYLNRDIRHDTTNAETIARIILKGLKFDNLTISNTCVLLKYCNINFEVHSEECIKKFITQVGEKNLNELFTLIFANIKFGLSNNISYNSVVVLKNKCEEILKKCEPLYIKDLAIDGNDLITIGLPKGKILGEVLNYLLSCVLRDKENNKRELLIELAKKYCNLAGYQL